MIEPTVGRIVWYRPYPETSCPAETFEGQPLAAIIVVVLSPRLVNIALWDVYGKTGGRQSVPLRQPEDDIPPRQPDPNKMPASGYCEWMPYQVKKKTGSESGEKAAGTEGI